MPGRLHSPTRAAIAHTLARPPLALPRASYTLVASRAGPRLPPSQGHRALRLLPARTSHGSPVAPHPHRAEKATAGFAEERQVPSTSVYWAVINGDAAAVKWVADDASGEVGILMCVNHSYLIRLSGLCVHHGDTYLVFEFAENGALRDWLHGNGYGGNTLRWRQRVQMAFDVADGLNYLHHYTNHSCVHKNLKSSSVLLDAGLRAKVSSFGLARAIAAADGGVQLRHDVMGTQGYLASEYLEHILITPKLELLSGKETAFAGLDEETLLWESAKEAYVEI